MGSTSSVMISMDADTVPVKKELTVLEKEINKLAGKKIPLEAQMEAFNQKAIEAKRHLTELRKSADREGLAGEIDKATKEMQEFAEKADKACDEIKLIDSQLNTMTNRFNSLKFTGSADNSIVEVGEKAKQSLGEAERAAGRLTKEVGNTKSSFKSVGDTVDKFGKRIANTFKSAFVFSVLYKGLNQLKERISAMLSTNQQFTTSLNQLKSNLAVAFQPIYQVAMPAINALMQLLVRATAYIAAFVNALFGTSLGASVSAAREMERSIQAVSSGAKGSTAAEKELTNAIKEKQRQVKALQRENKQLQREYEQQKKAVDAQTDALEKQISTLEKEISALQKAEQAANAAAQAQRDMIQSNIDALQSIIDQNNKASQAAQRAIDSQIKSLQSQQKSLDKQYKSETKAIDNRIKALQDEIKVIRKAQKAAQEAAKANQKFTADFDELSTLGTIEETDPYDAEIEKIQEKIDVLEEEKEATSDAYEQQKEAIQDTIDAYQEQKSAIADSYDAQNEKIQQQIDALQKAQDAIKSADYSSSISAYESRIDSLREKIDELNDSLEENPQIEQNEILIDQLQEEIDMLQEKKDAIQDASAAAGGFNADGLTKFNEQLDKLKEKLEESKLYKWLSENKEEIGQFITIFGSLLAVIIGSKGIIWAFSKFGDVLKWLWAAGGPLALVLAAISALIVYGGGAEEVINNVKEAFRLFGEGLIALINGDFETFKKKFIEGIINLANAGIAALESLLEAIRKGINSIVDKYNAFQEKMPWGDDDRVKMSRPFSDNHVSLPRIPIPALAAGAVLPPNKPFYAMLGDQKYGTNLEAPASLIEEIMRNVLAEQQYNFNITPTGSLGSLVRLLNLQITRENERETAF